MPIIDYDTYKNSGTGNSPHGRKQGINTAMSSMISGLDERAQDIAMIGRDAAGNTTSKSISRGGAFSNKEIGEMSYDQLKQSQQWEHDEQWYNAHDSYSAKVQEMQEAGLNPAMMYGGSMQTSSSASGAASGSIGGETASDVESSGLSGALGIISSLLGIGSQVNSAMVAQKNAESQRIVAESQANKNNAEADRARQDYDFNSETWDERKASLALDNAAKRMGITVSEQNIEESKTRITTMLQDANTRQSLASAQMEDIFQRLAISWNRDAREKELNDATLQQLYESTTAIALDNDLREIQVWRESLKKQTGIEDPACALVFARLLREGRKDEAYKLMSIYQAGLKGDSQGKRVGMQIFKEVIPGFMGAAGYVGGKVAGAIATGRIPNSSFWSSSYTMQY